MKKVKIQVNIYFHVTFYKWSTLAVNHLNISPKHRKKFVLFSMFQSKGKKVVSSSSSQENCVSLL